MGYTRKMVKDKFFEKFAVISQLIGIIFLIILAFLYADIRPVIVGFIVGWLLAIKGSNR